MSVGRPAALVAGTFVAHDAREQLFVALAELLAEPDRGPVSPQDVSQRANLPRETFDRYFENVDECLLEAFDAGIEQALAVAANAYMKAPGSWVDGIHAALEALLESVAGSPALTRMCLVDVMHVGPTALERRDRALERFSDFLEPGYALSPDPPPSVVSEAISGSVYELIRSRAIERRVESLPESLADATVITLSPFVGSELAEQVAARSAGMSTGD
jgi:AcrR family transcriptional regulator